MLILTDWERTGPNTDLSAWPCAKDIMNTIAILYKIHFEKSFFALNIWAYLYNVCIGPALVGLVVFCVLE